MITVENLTKEMERLYDFGLGFTASFAASLHPFIERHIAAGQQGAGDDAELDLSTHGVNRRWGIAYYEVDFGDEGKGVYVRREDFERIVRELATPQPPKPAGAVPLPEAIAWVDIGQFSLSGPSEWQLSPKQSEPEDQSLCTVADAIRYGDAREAAGRADAVPAMRFNELREIFVSINRDDDGDDYMNLSADAITKIDSWAAPAPQPTTTQGEDTFGRFASWLLDKCEGMEVSEEMLQQQLSAMIASGYGLTGPQP